MTNIDSSNCCICNPGIRKYEEHAKCKTWADKDMVHRYCRITGDFAQKKIDSLLSDRILKQLKEVR
jgi:hypothetical protein